MNHQSLKNGIVAKSFTYFNNHYFPNNQFGLDWPSFPKRDQITFFNRLLGNMSEPDDIDLSFRVSSIIMS